VSAAAGAIRVLFCVCGSPKRTDIVTKESGLSSFGKASTLGRSRAKSAHARTLLFQAWSMVRALQQPTGPVQQQRPPTGVQLRQVSPQPTGPTVGNVPSRRIRPSMVLLGGLIMYQVRESSKVLLRARATLGYREKKNVPRSRYM